MIRGDPQEIAKRLGNPKRAGGGWNCLCPVHEDHAPSLNVAIRNGVLLVKCFAGCSQGAVLAALKERSLIEEQPEPQRKNKPNSAQHGNERSPSRRIDKTYNYCSVDGNLLFQTVRYYPKGEAGRKHAQAVAASAHGHGSAMVRIVELPNLGDGEDAYDWIARGGTKDELLRLVADSSPYEVPEDSGARKSEGTPEPPRPLMRKKEPAADYPVEDLGDLLGNAAKAIHDKIQAPIAVCGTSVLAASALATQGVADLVLPTGQRRPLSLYCVTIAETGERKSSVDQEATAPIDAYEAELRARHAVDLRAYEVKSAAWKAQQRDILGDKKLKSRSDKEGALKDLGPPPSAPLEPMLTSPEPTFEGVCRLLAIGHPSIGVFSDEGGQFIGGHAMNQDNRLKTAAGLSSIWSKGLIKRLRAADGAQILAGRRLSMHLMVQPDVAGLLLCDRLLQDQGFLSRLLISAPDSAAGTRPWHDPLPESESALANYHVRIHAILSQELPYAVDRETGKMNEQELDPRGLPLSDGARQLWIEFSDACDASMAPGGSLETIKAFANKLPEQAARIAGVLALIEDLAARQIAEHHLARGIRLVQYHAAEAGRLARAGVANATLLLANKVLSWLQNDWKHPLISLPDLYQRGPNQVRDKATAKNMLDILVDHGWLEEVEGGSIVDGVPRREVWSICGGEGAA